MRAALPSTLGKHFPGKTEGQAHCLSSHPVSPQSEKASREEAGGDEYVNLCSSGQTSEELAPSRGVSNLVGGLVHGRPLPPPPARLLALQLLLLAEPL